MTRWCTSSKKTRSMVRHSCYFLKTTSRIMWKGLARDKSCWRSSGRSLKGEGRAMPCLWSTHPETNLLCPCITHGKHEKAETEAFSDGISDNLESNPSGEECDGEFSYPTLLSEGSDEDPVGSVLVKDPSDLKTKLTSPLFLPYHKHYKCTEIWPHIS